MVEFNGDFRTMIFGFLYSQEYLGTAGVKAIYDANERIGKETPLPPARVLKVLYLVQRVTFVPLTAENIAKLLASSVGRPHSSKATPLSRSIQGKEFSWPTATST